MKRVFNFFKKFIFLWVLISYGMFTFAAEVAPPLKWVEKVEVIRGESDTRLRVQGSAPSDFASVSSVKSDRYDIAIEAQEEIRRPNGEVEFQFDLTSPKFMHGGYFSLPLNVEYKGNRQTLVFQSGESLTGQIKVTKKRHWFILAVVLIVIGLGFWAAFVKWCEKLGTWMARNQRPVALGIVGFALILVAIGFTGSSWQMWARSVAGNSFLDIKGSAWSSRSHQIDRWDEWAVITPAVSAQLNHNPRFPIVNTHIGPEGQNMGVVGMFGVPIAQISALARPAAWGYFFLPLSQAMAWQWQIQFWGCLLAVWWLLNIIGGAHTGRNLALAAAFCTAPYAAGWSNWSLYASLFPVLGVCLFTTLLRTKPVAKAMLLGVALGWVVSSWVLVLYPPWLVIVGSLCALLTLGWVIDHRRELSWGLGQWLALGCMVAAAGGLLGSWWFDTRDAVAQVQATVYPGGRQTELGGTASLIWSMRGYLGMEVFANADGIGASATRPEVSSYFFVPLGMAAVLLLGILKSSRSRATWWGLSTFVIGYVWYSFLGFPLWLAQVTKWGVMTTNRMDVGLGLATVVFASLICSRSSKEIEASDKGSASHLIAMGVGGVIALASAGLAWWVLAHVSPTLIPHNSLPYRLAIVLICAATAWWMWNSQTVGVTLALLVMAVGAGFSYTPISLAPRGISLVPQVKPFVTQANSANLARTLVVDEASLPATTLAALGVPVINGALYYPHRSMWRNLQLPEDQWPTVNRYQHLIFVPRKETVSPLPYQVTSPSMDAVTVHFDAKAFDFSATGAERVVSHKSLASSISGNSRLEKIGEYRDYVWFAVK